MSKRTTKLVINFEGAELNALIGNAGMFQNCDGLDSQLLKIDCINLPRTKFSFTQANFLQMYQGVNAALNGPRYPGKSGSEYSAMCRIKEIMQREYQRQLNEPIST